MKTRDDNVKYSALEFLYAREVRHHYVIWRIESPGGWQVFVDNTGDPTAVMLMRRLRSSYEAVVVAETFVGLQALLKHFPAGEVQVEADSPWAAHCLGRSAKTTMLAPFVRMAVDAGAFRPRPDDRVLCFDASLTDAFKRNRIWSRPEITDRALDQARSAQSEWVIVEDGCVVCKCDVLRRTERCSELNEVITAPDCRGRGLATAVAAKATQWVLSNGRVPVYSVSAGNVPSLRLAQTLGYRPVANTVRLRVSAFR